MTAALTIRDSAFHKVCACLWYENSHEGDQIVIFWAPLGFRKFDLFSEYPVRISAALPVKF